MFFECSVSQSGHQRFLCKNDRQKLGIQQQH